jgi:hypothetical protein
MSVIANWTWIATNAPVATSRTDDIWFFDDSAGWLLNSNGQVCQTTDGGESWSQKLFVAPGPPTYPYLRCMGWPSRNVGWIGAVTSGEMNYLDILLHKTEDGGKTWRAMKNMPQGSPAGICGMYAVTESLMSSNPASDPRTRINRYRFLGSPPTLGYCREARPLQILIGLLISNGPGSITAQGAKGAVAATGRRPPAGFRSTRR